MLAYHGIVIGEPLQEDVVMVRFTAELTCLLCGRSHGSLDGGSSWPPQGAALLQRPGDAQASPVNGWWRLRCATCGGALMATEITSHAVRLMEPVDWATVGIRRGRPPKWLVAERVAAGVPARPTF